MSTKKTPEEVLDQIIDAVRADEPSREAVKTSAERLSAELFNTRAGSEQIRSCEDFQRLVPAYLDGSLTEARALLVQDHVHNCVACRKALTRARTADMAEPVRPMNKPVSTAWLKWGSLAAGLILLLGLAQMGLLDAFLPFHSTAWAKVEETDGLIYRVEGQRNVPIQAGDRLEAGQFLRTGKQSGAVLRLGDGSRIEVAARSELGLSGGFRGENVRLHRGSIIVSATDQDSGRLFVTTDNFEVAVTGTVFSVNKGLKGSRVSVLAGEVVVSGPGNEAFVRAGEQYSSNPALAPVALVKEVEWSRNREQHLELLKEFTSLQRDFQRATYSDQLRFTSTLLDSVPAEAFVVAAVPNLSGKVEETYEAFLDRVRNNAVLQEWYEANVGVEEQILIDELVGQLNNLGATIGEELIFAVAGTDPQQAKPVLFAETKDPVQLQALIEQQLQMLATLSGEPVPAQIITDPAEAIVTENKELFVLINGDFFVVSPSLELVSEVLSGPTAFVGTPFYGELAAAYADGVDWLFGINLGEVIIHEGGFGAEEQASLSLLGIEQVKSLIFERKQVGGIAENRAELSFDQVGDGLLSWVAEPGPMGGLEFVSPDAHLAAAFVVKAPAELVADIFEFVRRSDARAWDEMVRFEGEHGISIQHDLAAPLGGEVVFALDGAVLPTPSWKMILEVDNPSVLQSTIERIVKEVNRMTLDSGQQLVLEVGDLDGWPLFSIKSVEAGLGFEYAFHDGYMIAGPNREVIQRAIQFKTTGYTMAGSPEFVSQLSSDPRLNMSAVVYNNLSSLLNPVLNSRLAGSLSRLSETDQQTLATMAAETPPMMLGLYHEPGRITISSSGDIESIWMNLGTFSQMGGAESLDRILGGLEQ